MLGHLFARLRPLAPIIATFALDREYSMLVLPSSERFGRRSPWPDPVGSWFLAPS